MLDLDINDSTAFGKLLCLGWISENDYLKCLVMCGIMMLNSAVVRGVVGIGDV